MYPETKTPKTHPEHHTVGHLFRSYVDMFLYYCDSHVENMGYWMTRTDDPSDRRNVSERAIGRTFHEPNEPELREIEFLKAFSDAIPVAVTNHEAGFHFEEGGCWGMAKALHELFDVCQMDPVVLVREGEGIHAMVRSLDGAYDHQGMGRISKNAVAVNVAELAVIAARNGISDDEFVNDTMWAQSIVASAVESIDTILVPSAWIEHSKKSGPKP